MTATLLISGFNTAKYEYFLAGHLEAAWVEEPEAATFGYVVDHLPLILLNLVDFHVAHEVERLVACEVRESLVNELLAAEHKYVLVIK